MPHISRYNSMMPFINLHHANRAQVHALLADSTWCVACLCAAWCNTCGSFRSSFEALAARHPDKVMLWVDIEDEAEVVGDFDIENFPTLLIQRGTQVAFLGTIEPNAAVAHRLVEAQTRAWHGIDSDGADHRNGPASNLDLRTKLAALLST